MRISLPFITIVPVSWVMFYYQPVLKMLKSHSLSNLSVSDPWLYPQFSSLALPHMLSHPAQAVLHKGKRASDEQSVTSTDTDHSEPPPRHRYVSAKDNKVDLKEQQQNQQQQQHRRYHLDLSHHKSPSDYYHSDSSSSIASSEYHFVSCRDREWNRVGKSRQRGDLRYASIPEDAHEINNNLEKKELAAGSRYYSCHDLTLAGSTNTSNYDQVQGQGHPKQVRHPHDQVMVSDQMYGGRGPHTPDVVPVTVQDPGDLVDTARSRSMGNLSTGLAFSVIGQRKADSMLDLSSSSAPAPPFFCTWQGPRPPTLPHTTAARHRNEHAGPYLDHRRYPKEYIGSSRHSCQNNSTGKRTLRRRSSEEGDVFSSSSHHPPLQHANGYYNAMNNHNQRSATSQHTDSSARQQLQQNGLAYRSSVGGSDSSSTSWEQTSQGDVVPPKPKRSLPYVPLNDTTERIKRFTEIMRTRMSVSISGSRSTANSAMSQSQTPTTPHTPLSRQASITTDNSSDCEVSTLLDARQKDATTTLSERHHSEGEKVQNYCRQRRKDGADGGGERNRPHPHPHRQPSFSQGMPQLHAASDSGQTPLMASSHSHSSTMDSGYTTNNEGDGDSTANSSHYHLSPPHHHPPKPHYSQHSHYSHPNYHPHPQHAEASSHPTPQVMPRNLSLAAARKLSSMQNISTGSTGNSGPPPPHPVESEGSAIRNQARPPPPPLPLHSSGGPVPMCAQHSSNSRQVEHQRKSWDLAHNFKSLDFMPVIDNSQRRRTCAQGSEDMVVKPQAVSLNIKQQKHEVVPASPQREESGHSRPDDASVKGIGGSFKDSQQYVNNSYPPTSDTVNHWTLLVHRKCSNTNITNTHNNNDTKKNTRNKNNSIMPCSLHLKPSTITTNNSGDIVNALPTLFQLSQTFALCSAKLYLPVGLTMGRLITLTSFHVALPSDAAGSPPVQSPQGRCARLGGPGSAFRPVRSGSLVGRGIATAEVMGVGSMVDPQICQQMCVLGEVCVGDLLVEVNGRQCVGMEGASLQQLLDSTQEEVMVTLARPRKEDKADNQVKQLESSLHNLQVEVQRMKEELSKKDARIRELSTMLPWKREEEGNVGNGLVTPGAEEGVFVIGDNEFVV